MLPIDRQAELIHSFQEEKRQRYQEMRERERSISGKSLSARARFLRFSGGALIAAGRGLQRAAGGSLTGDFDGRRLDWKSKPGSA